MHLSSLGREAGSGRAFPHTGNGLGKGVAARTRLVMCLGKEKPFGLESKTSPRCHCRSDEQQQV